MGPNFAYSLGRLILEQFVTTCGQSWAKVCLEVEHLTLVNHMDQSTVWVTRWAGRSCAGGTNFSSLKLWQLVAKVRNIFLFTVSQCLQNQFREAGIMESVCVKVLSALQKVKICSWRIKALSLQPPWKIKAPRQRQFGWTKHLESFRDIVCFNQYFHLAIHL